VCSHIRTFPRAVDRLNVHRHLYRFRTGAGVWTLHQTTFCAAFILYWTIFLFFKFTVVYSFNLYTLLTYLITVMLRGSGLCTKHMIYFMFFSYVVNNAQVWWWPVRRPKLVSLEIAVFLIAILLNKCVYWRVSLFLEMFFLIERVIPCRHHKIGLLASQLR